MISKLSLEQKVRLLTGADFWALLPEPAVGLRRLVVSDGPAGVRGERWDERDPSANIPSPTALAATWDVSRVAAIGRLLAGEARRKGVDMVLAPTVNLQRTPYAGRHFECFSEDPLLTAAIGTAYVRGLQSQGVSACVKHFVGNDSETERFTLDARIAERPLRELYLAPFEAVVRDAGVWSVMAAYNGVNGHTMTESPLLRSVLHEEWGFDGLVVSDWTAARSTEETARAALDLVMPGPAAMFGVWGDALVEAVRAGKVDEALIDDKVERLLRLAGRVGALGGSVPVPVSVDVPAELRETAAASFVLVRNASLLPLFSGAEFAGAGFSGAEFAGAEFSGAGSADPGPVAVIGPNAALARTMGGGSASVSPAYTVSPLDGLRAALHRDRGVDVRYAAGLYGHGRVPAAGPPWLYQPDGVTPGVEVRFFGAGGERLGSELRGVGSLTWMDGFGPRYPADAVARLEVHCQIKATAAGPYRLGASALGRCSLTVRGTSLFDTELTLPEGADVVESLMTPPQFIAPVSLAADESVPVVFSYDVTSSPFGGFLTTLQLNLEQPHGTDDEEIAAAAALAASCSAAVVVVGTTAETESEGTDRTTLALPGRQDDLVRAVVAANPRTVVVVNSGSPVLMPWAADVPAILLTWFGGQEYGNALADVLLGVREPGGRLPTTWPASSDGLPSVTPVDGVLCYDEGLFIGYRAYDRDGREPLFAFGHGLGYTTWSYESISVNVDSVDVTLINTGSRPGRSVVQVYASRPSSAVERPVKWLAGFAVAEAGPGSPVTVTVPLGPRAFRHWAQGEGWVTEPGQFNLAAGPSSASLPLTATVDIS